MHPETRGPAARVHKRKRQRAVPLSVSRMHWYSSPAFENARRLPSLPRPRIVPVSKRKQLAPAFRELARCNVFGICVSSRPFCARRNGDLKNAVFVRGEMRNPPALLTIAGVNVADTRPRPRRAGLGAGEWEGEVFVFDLNKLLLESAQELHAWLAPLLEDPEKLIVGVGVEQDLRTLARAYADSVPCFGGTVRGVREVGLLAGETAPRSVRALTVLYAGFDLDMKLHLGAGVISPNFAKPKLSGGVRALPAREARAAVMVYLGAGAQAFAGEEKTVELGLVSVYLCRKCGEASLEFRTSPWCACGGWQALGCASSEKGNLERWLSKVEVPASDVAMQELYGFTWLEACERMADKERALLRAKGKKKKLTARGNVTAERKVNRFSEASVELHAASLMHERGSSDAGEEDALLIED